MHSHHDVYRSARKNLKNSQFRLPSKHYKHEKGSIMKTLSIALFTLILSTSFVAADGRKRHSHAVWRGPSLGSNPKCLRKHKRVTKTYTTTEETGAHAPVFLFKFVNRKACYIRGNILGTHGGLQDENNKMPIEPIKTMKPAQKFEWKIERSIFCIKI